MPQHREVDPKNLGISPEDEAIQEFINQAGSAPAEKPVEKPDDDKADETDENEE